MEAVSIGYVESLELGKRWRASQGETMSSTAGKKRVTFAVEAEPESEVAVAGTFNGWQPVPLSTSKQGGAGTKFKKMIYLPAGRYEYKFVIDGNWSIDPNCPSWSPNEYGSLNSVVDVR
jgi:1,4-alpha-glucan branching enzyme